VFAEVAAEAVDAVVQSSGYCCCWPRSPPPPQADGLIHLPRCCCLISFLGAARAADNLLFLCW
jgi:hypothetical protein